MAVWVVRAGSRGEQEQIAIDNNLVTIGWNELPDLSDVTTREVLAELYRQHNSDASPNKAANHVGQIWAFRERIKEGDLAVLPLHIQSAIAIGRIRGPYEYRTDLGSEVHHVRPVEWIRTDIPRTAFDQDILYSFGAYMTVCQITRNNAEERIKAVLAGRAMPSLEIGATGEVAEGEESLDIEQAAGDQLLDHIQRKFAGHKLAILVDAVLQAEGYLTRVSPPGPDGGVDILAGAGPMGFGPPRMCVQVKSSPDPADVVVLRGLQGVLQNFRADQGLLVCWGGFKSSVIQEARQSFFTVRLWDSGDLLQAILKNYEKLPADLQAELPLKRIWALVLEG
ncbi:MAG: restriction endonuclease [Thermoguttaceae bacterium]